MRTVHLYHLPTMLLPLPPLTMSPPLTAFLPIPRLHQPPPQRLITHLDPLPLQELLRSQGGAKSLISLLVKLYHPRFYLILNPPVGRLPPGSVHDPSISLSLDSLR